MCSATSACPSLAGTAITWRSPSEWRRSYAEAEEAGEAGEAGEAEEAEKQEAEKQEAKKQEAEEQEAEKQEAMAELAEQAAVLRDWRRT